MQMFPDDLPLANIDADGYCCHFMRSSVRPTIHGLGFVYCIQSAWKKWPSIWHADVSRWLTLSIQYTCGYGGYLLPLLAAHSRYTFHFNEVERGVYWFHLVSLSVCGQNRVCSVSSTILVDPFHICTSYQATSEGVSRVMFV